MMLQTILLFATLASPALGFFGGSDFRCRFFGGKCYHKHEICCPKGWIEDVCSAPESCCIVPSDCEKQDGTCLLADEYCPGGFDDSVSCLGAPTPRKKCCFRNSACEIQHKGRCIKSGETCKGTPIAGVGLCGPDSSYVCCDVKPGKCVVGKTDQFCEFKDNTLLTISSTPSDGSSAMQNLQDQCSTGNMLTSPTQCGGKRSCIHNDIIEYLSCIQAACPQAKVLAFGGNTFGGDSNSPHCSGRAVALEIDMNSAPETCDITNVEQFCYEVGKTGVVELTSPNVYLVRCVV